MAIIQSSLLTKLKFLTFKRHDFVIIIGLVLLVVSACQSSTNKTVEDEQIPSIEERVVNLSEELNKILDEPYVINLNHHKMAKEEGVYTPPSIATIFSDPVVNTEVIIHNQLAGIDLPFKVLCYSEADTTKVTLAYTSSEFIAKRHGLEKSTLSPYKERLEEVVSSLNPDLISKTIIDSVGIGYGIINIKSDYDFAKTVNNLKAIVESQNDTRWFGEIDFQKDAKTLNQNIEPTMLLLFGGPGPGGKAMMTTPKIGLDAFCQKLLVYQYETGEVWVAFNDITAFSELYYGTSTKPQKVINERLIETFTKAVKKEN